jgi:signal transduction histidine kinase
LLIGLLREGLNNVRKHARAGRVTLRIERDGDRIAFYLADDGAGFCPPPALASSLCPLRQTPTRQYGLAYLRERVAGVGGTLSVVARPGEGTVLEAGVPLLTEERLLSRFSRGEGGAAAGESG